MAKSYTIDKERFRPTTSPTGKGRWYFDVVGRVKVPRSQAIKLSQGLSHSQIARERRQERIEKSSHRREEARRALRRQFGSEKHDLFRQAMRELDRLWSRKPRVNKARRYRQDEEYLRKWREFSQDVEDWSRDYGIEADIDWEEFWADSPAAE